jgi:hypothetical protein
LGEYPIYSSFINSKSGMISHILHHPRQKKCVLKIVKPNAGDAIYGIGVTA